VANEIMRIENFFTHYKNQLISRQQQVEDAILGGLCKSWDEYRYLTGKLDALKQEEQELTDLLRKTELEDE
jgi:cell shape-determining protein MreC